MLHPRSSLRRLVLALLLVATGHLAATAAPPSFIVTGGGVSAQDRTAYEARAGRDWEATSDRADARVLDAFIERWPDADAAADAFAIRFELVRAAGTIPAYHDLIAAHPQRLGTQLAIAELFELYRAEDRLPGYIDFVGRYPNTAEAMVARAHAEQLAFTFATKLDTVAAYDGFLLAFPDAPQAVAAADLARRTLLAEHEAAYDAAAASRTEDELEDWVNRRLRSMRFDYRDLWTAITAETPTPQVLEFLERSVLGRRPSEINDRLRLNLAQRMERLYYVVRWFRPYQTAEASDTIVAEARHQELITKLEEIRTTLIEQHDSLVGALREEMRLTRDTLRSGFEDLIAEHRLDRQVMQQGFTRLEESMEVLHQDLGAIYGELRSIHGTMADVAAGIRETNVRLGRLDQRLEGVHRSLVAMHRDMNRGFDNVTQSVTRLNRDMNRGFDRQYAIAEAQLNVAVQSLEVQQQTLGAINHGFDRLDSTMQAGFTRLEDATWGAASMVADSNRELAASFGGGGGGLGGLFGGGVGGGGGAGGGGGGFFQTALGTAGSFIPGVGPIVGTVAGNVLGSALDSAVAGERIDPLELGKTAFTAGVGKKYGTRYPAAAGIAGGVYDQVVTERRDTYARAASTFAAAAKPAARAAVMAPAAPWRARLATADTPAAFDAVATDLGSQLGISNDAISFAIAKIF